MELNHGINLYYQCQIIVYNSFNAFFMVVEKGCVQISDSYYY